MEKILFSWSGGKDSALALNELLNEEDWEIAGLLTTISESGKVPMHEVSEKLIEKQALQTGIPLVPVYLPERAENDVYEQRLSEQLRAFRSLGVEKVVHGDIFLEDVRVFRDKQLARLGMNGVYPLWGKSTKELSRRFVSKGFRSIVTCVDTNLLPQGWVGREYDREFLANLPEGIDPCGENGEFHTFVYDGPIFKEPVRFKKAEPYSTWNGRFVHLPLK